MINDTHFDDKYRAEYALVDYGDDLSFELKSYWMGTGDNQFFTLG